MFDYFMNEETDNLNPEGLDLLLLKDDGTEILFNRIYLSNDTCKCECNVF